MPQPTKIEQALAAHGHEFRDALLNPAISAEVLADEVTKLGTSISATTIKDFRRRLLRGTVILDTES